MRKENSPARFYALVPAAGTGTRMGLSTPKQYLELAGKTMLERSVGAVLSDPRVRGVLVVASPSDARIGALAFPPAVKVARCGGQTRAHTVRNGLQALLGGQAFEVSEDDWVLVHDAARPFVTKEEIGSLLDAAGEGIDGALLAMPVVDTVKESGPGAMVRRTLDRSVLWRAATPQMFRAGALLEALSGDLGGITDESSAMERSGAAVRLVPCGALNFKVTRPEDAVVAGLLAGGEGKEGEAMREMRVGQGFDNHRLCSGRRLVLGGVEIPFELGLDGHSDADALLHALTDAVLGAAGLGDIGEHFPPSDMRWKGADSRALLGQVMREVRAAGCWVIAFQSAPSGSIGATIS